MSNTVDTIEKLFEKQVGSEAAREDFRATLSGAAKMARNTGVNPYNFILEMMEMDMGVEIALLKIEDPTVDRGRLVENASLGRFAQLQTLQTIGAIYTKRPDLTHYRSTVERSVDAATRHVFEIAFAGSRAAGFVNLESMAAGTDPSSIDSKLMTVRKMASRGNNDFGSVSEDFFTAVVNPEGQLDVRPRYDVYKSDEGMLCPATGARVDVDNTSRSALFTSMQILSGVVVADVYPGIFPVASDPS